MMAIGLGIGLELGLGKTKTTRHTKIMVLADKLTCNRRLPDRRASLSLPLRRSRRRFRGFGIRLWWSGTWLHPLKTKDQSLLNDLTLRRTDRGEVHNIELHMRRVRERSRDDTRRVNALIT